MIATPKGERPIMELSAGDRVITRDNGIQMIRRVTVRSLDAHELTRADYLRPILIRGGALDGERPERDALVSPNQRILTAGESTAFYAEDGEVLVAAKHLTGMEGADQVDASQLSYVHLMFDRSEVVLANGVWSECFNPSDEAQPGQGNAQRTELYEILPELKPVARTTPGGLPKRRGATFQRVIPT